MMTPHHWLILGLAAFALGVYVWRLNGMTWRTHLPRCVSAQMLGAIVACGLIYQSAGHAAPNWLYATLICVWLHLTVTEDAWRAGPPPESESRPMDLDGAMQ
jgi:peptidoglycan/LPS O-acetylase OafA/YrhL